METDMLATLNKYRRVLLGLAALVIFINHAATPMFTGLFIGPVEDFIIYTGFYCVDLFFFLAAIGQVFSIKKHSLKEFYVNRFKRLIMPFWLVGVLKCLAFYLDWGNENLNHFYRWNITDFFKGVTGYMFFTDNIGIHLWFIPALIIFSFLFPLYYKIFSKFKNKYIFTGVVLLIWFAASVLLKNILRPDFYGLTNRIPVFLLGVLAGDMSYNGVKIKKTPLRIVELIVIWLVGIVTMYLTQFHDVYILVESSKCFGPTLCRTIGVAFLFPLVFDAFMKNKEVKNISSLVNKVLEFYGKISLEFYAVQEFLVYIVLDMLFAFSLNMAILNFLSLVAVTICALPVFVLNKYFQKFVERVFGCGKSKNLKDAKN